VGGSSIKLGTVTVDRGALRSGRHPCPPSIVDMFQIADSVIRSGCSSGPGSARTAFLASSRRAWASALSLVMVCGVTT